MPGHDRGDRRPQAVRDSTASASKIHERLDQVHIALLLVVEGVEEQALLQRGERVDVLELRRCAHVGLLSRLSMESIWSWDSETSDRSDGVRPPAPGSSACRASAVRASPQAVVSRCSSASGSRAVSYVQVTDSRSPSRTAMSTSSTYAAAPSAGTSRAALSDATSHGCCEAAGRWPR